VSEVIPLARSNRRPLRSSDYCLQAESVSKRFVGVEALRAVDIALHRGDLLGLIGPNGSGKTTLINILSGFLRGSSGTVRIGALDVTRWPAHRIARAGVGRTFQSVRLFRHLTVLENVAVGATGGQQRDSGGEARRRARATLAQLEVTSWANRAAGDLPYGIQRRVDIARALVAAPDFLLLDEPAAGMNPAETESLRLHIAGIRSSLGIGILVVDHDLRLIMTLCDRIVVLDSGSVIAVGTPDEIASNPAVIEAYIGSQADPLDRAQSSA
jgi:branched-chain amino acid transport system permease protein